MSRNINPTNDTFLKDFLPIYSEWSRADNYTDMYVAETRLITKSINVAKLSQPNQFGQIMLRPLFECRNAVKNHRDYRHLKLNEFEKYLIQLNEIENELKIFLDFYNYSLNSKTKRD